MTNKIVKEFDVRQLATTHDLIVADIFDNATGDNKRNSIAVTGFKTYEKAKDFSNNIGGRIMEFIRNENHSAWDVVASAKGPYVKFFGVTEINYDLVIGHPLGKQEKEVEGILMTYTENYNIYEIGVLLNVIPMSRARL